MDLRDRTESGILDLPTAVVLDQSANLSVLRVYLLLWKGNNIYIKR